MGSKDSFEAKVLRQLRLKQSAKGSGRASILHLERAVNCEIRAENAPDGATGAESRGQGRESWRLKTLAWQGSEEVRGFQAKSLAPREKRHGMTQF